MEQDLHSRVKAVIAAEHAIHTATKVGPIIDTQGFESLAYIVQVGDALVGGGFTVLLEEGDDSGLSDAAALPAANRQGVLPVFVATDTDVIKRVGSTGKKRFQRLTLTETGTVTAGIIGASAVLSNEKNAPVAAQ